MSNISIQFHAAPTELEAFVQAIVAEFRLRVTGIALFPHRAVELPVEVVGAVAAAQSNEFCRLVFTLEAPVLKAEKWLAFCDSNASHLRLDLGRLTPDGLEQSWLAASTDDAASLRVWRGIARRLMRITRAGMIAINKESGAEALIKSFRFTEGAEVMERSGIAMLPPQGPRGPRMRLGKERTSDGVTR